MKRPLRSFAWVAGGVLVVGLLIVLLVQRQLRVEKPKMKDLTAPQPVAHATVEMPEFVFSEVGEERGIRYVHRNGAEGDKLLPETMGGGVAVLDVEGDGDADLLFVGGRSWSPAESASGDSSLALYLNDGAGRFNDATRSAGLFRHVFGMGVAVGDADNDGDPDLYVTAVGGNHFFRNDGGRFVDITTSSGTGGDPSAWATGAGFFDADNDGDLDLFVAHYVRWSRELDFEVGFTLNGRDRAYGPPNSFEGTYPVLYRNDGNLRFSDISEQAGIEVDNPSTSRPMAKGLGVSFVDFGDDGWTDIVLANDTVQNFVFQNLGNGLFKEIGAEVGIAFDSNGNATGGMGLDVAVHRNDGLHGVAIGNFANEMTSLYVQQSGSWQFADEAIIEGVGAASRRALSFAVLFADFDLDGRLDLLQVNGHLEEAIAEVQASQRYRQAAQLFWNSGLDGPTTFVPVPEDELGDLTRPIVGRGVSCADFDDDGDLDLVLMENGGSPLLLLNEQDTGHNWLRVRLEGTTANRDAIGAVIEVECGDAVQRRRVVPTRSYLSQTGLPVTFGLGLEDTVGKLTIRWPGGGVQSVAVEGVNREIVVRQAR